MGRAIPKNIVMYTVSKMKEYFVKIGYTGPAWTSMYSYSVVQLVDPLPP